MDPYGGIDFYEIFNDMTCPALFSYKSDPQSYPLIRTLSKFSLKETPWEDEYSIDPALIEYRRLTEEQKYYMTIDDVFCVYLRTVSKKVNLNFYKLILKFVILYRECINKYGWKKKEEWDRKNGIFDRSPQIGEYCFQNNAEMIPDISNEFVTIFLDDNPCLHLERCDAIDLTWNLCSWLYSNGHTCSWLSVINNHIE